MWLNNKYIIEDGTGFNISCSKATNETKIPVTVTRGSEITEITRSQIMIMGCLQQTIIVEKTMLQVKYSLQQNKLNLHLNSIVINWTSVRFTES
jgi:hypothetical protein